MQRGGKTVSLGYFATAEEAALCIARTPEGRVGLPARARGTVGRRNADDAVSKGIMVSRGVQTCMRIAERCTDFFVLR